MRVNKVGIGIGTVGIPPRLLGSIHTCIYLIVTWNVRVGFIRKFLPRILRYLEFNCARASATC